MAKTTAAYAISLYYSLTTFLTLLLNLVSLANSGGLKITTLIHQNSPYFYPNLSSEETVKRLVLFQSHSSGNMQSRTPTSRTPPTSQRTPPRMRTPLTPTSRTPPTPQTTPISAHIDVQTYHYIVKVGIGTIPSTNPPYKEYHLQMDTGSSTVWMQCQGCTKCFDQTPPLFFPYTTSQSFATTGGRTDFPEPFNLTYTDKSTTSGILAHETFHLKSKSGNVMKIPRVLFGCGIVNNNMNFPKVNGHNRIVGVMGLGWDSPFLTSVNRKFFYYLLPLPLTTFQSYLTLGNTVPTPSVKIGRTPLQRRAGTKFYSLDMQGISLNNKRLNINANEFRLNIGTTIDTGCPVTRLVSRVFDVLKRDVEAYFLQRLKWFKKMNVSYGALELCYESSMMSQGFKSLSDITFHLASSNAEFVMKPQATSKVIGVQRLGKPSENVCLAMIKDPMMTIIGANSQTNQKIVIDTNKREMLFNLQD
ncbi:eukaryotic aspartyl protease family protein [Striga asiatica]|uniref:Eukaryotic aspartyl protease family protein n=1 Tax=Striga asiatica TaxID=4170 RepID=A0A5A7Q298_STRAF|nr:eukaryotic aspartyl protease family protein [Striga asiatica]